MFSSYFKEALRIPGGRTRTKMKLPGPKADDYTEESGPAAIVSCAEPGQRLQMRAPAGTLPGMRSPFHPARPAEARLALFSATPDNRPCTANHAP